MISDYFDPYWKFGYRRNQGWRRCLRLPEPPLFLNLSGRGGVIIGMAEQGVDMSLLRLATNAAHHLWKVIYFDALGQDDRAALFLVAMQQAGLREIRIFPHEPYDGWRGPAPQVCQRLLQVSPFYRVPYHQHNAAVCLSAALAEGGVTSMRELLSRLARKPRRGDRTRVDEPVLAAMRQVDFTETLLRFGALSTLLGTSCDGKWSFVDADAAYCSFNALAEPLSARAQASFLLADLASSLGGISRSKGVLLLIRHPELLFEPEQLAPCLLGIEQLGGSVFLTARSPADLGKGAMRFFANAQTVLLHRSNAWLRDLPVPLSGQREQAFFRKATGQLPDDECFVIRRGHALHVRLDPVRVPMVSVRAAHASLAQSPALPATGEEGAFAPFRAPQEPLDPDLASWLAEEGITVEVQYGAGTGSQETVAEEDEDLLR